MFRLSAREWQAVGISMFLEPLYELDLLTSFRFEEPSLTKPPFICEEAYVVERISS